MISTEFYEMVLATILLFHQMSTFSNNVTVMLTKIIKHKNRNCHTPIFHCINKR